MGRCTVERSKTTREGIIMRGINGVAVAACTLSALILGGCGDSSPESGGGAASPTPSASETSRPPAPTPEPDPDKDGDGVADWYDDYPRNPAASEAQVITVICDVKGREDLYFEIDRVKPNFKKAWRTVMPEERGMFNGVYCESDAEYGPKLTPVSEIEQVIWDADKRPSRYTIPIPYELCVEHGTRSTTNEWPRSKAQVREAEEALLLCPRHPDAPAIRSRIADQQVVATQLRQGRAFWDGNFRVGPRVKPGTYFTTDVTGCYWERLDSSGEIIDNNFVSKALRVEVTIAPTDFSFHAEGCQMWRPVQ
jgi:hypothetical protein